MLWIYTKQTFSGVAVARKKECMSEEDRSCYYVLLEMEGATVYASEG